MKVGSEKMAENGRFVELSNAEIEEIMDNSLPEATQQPQNVTN